MLHKLNYTTQYNASFEIIVTDSGDEKVLFSRFPDECMEELEDEGIEFLEDTDGDNANGPVEVYIENMNFVLDYLKKASKQK